MEIFKDIEEVSGCYQISDCGNIKSLERVVPAGIGFRKISERIIRPALNKVTGYMRVHLSIKQKAFHRSVHRLIAVAFIPNPLNKREVNHINGIKTDNRIENLEWVTSSENTRHANKNGLAIRKNNKGSKKLAQLKDGVLIKLWPSGAEVSRSGYNIRNIKSSIKKNQKCAGFTWQAV